MIKVRNLDTITQPTPQPQPETKQDLFKLFCTESGQITESEINRDLLTAPVPEAPQQASGTPGPEQTNLNDILHDQAAIAAKLGATVCITGYWVWAEFKGIPNKDTRDTLKANSWIWCSGKGKWAYRGKPCTAKKAMSWDYILNKYGEEKINTGELINV